jgi:CRP-like cAMP-binding protein
MTTGLRVPAECEACVCGKAARARGGACPFTEQAYERGEHLFHEGEIAERVWFVKRGTVVLARGADGANARARAVRRSGSFVGLEALVSPRHLDTARASEPTVACSAPIALVDEWLGTPGMPARMALEQQLRAEVAEPLHAASPDGKAIERVARWILAEPSVHDGAVRPLLRRDVAGLLGMAAETFSRALAELTRLGAIEITRKQLCVKDRAVLAAAAQRE